MKGLFYFGPDVGVVVTWIQSTQKKSILCVLMGVGLCGFQGLNVPLKQRKYNFLKRLKINLSMIGPNPAPVFVNVVEIYLVGIFYRIFLK